jgi:hypothetical protein
MRMFIVLTSLAVMAGCASPATTGRLNAYEQLSQTCRARGGTLLAIPGANSINDAANYSCEFRGQRPKGPAWND